MTCLPVRQIHFEISSRCNAACQLCPRHEISEHGYHKSLNLIEQDLPLELLTDLVNDPLLADCRKWLLCGNLGEPMMHPDIIDIVRTLLANDRWLSMHTNGGIGNIDTWHELGNLLQVPRGQILFSIDGLEDTNHIYRRNVSWDLLMRNSQAFMQSGGFAIWKFIDFSYNHHQISEARAMAKQLGFARFAVDTNSSAPLEPYAQLEYQPFFLRAEKTFVDDALELDVDQQNAEWRKDTVLDCEHTKFHTIYIDAQARVWPCCHVSNVLMYNDSAHKRVGARWLLDPYGKDWNDLNKHSIGTILSNPYWTDLYASLPGNTGLYKCSHSCGTAPVRTREREMFVP
jgi:hypothetical protein